MQLRGLRSLCCIIVAAVSFQCISAVPGEIEDSCKAIVAKHPDVKKVFCQASLVAASKMINSSTDPNELAGALAKFAISNADVTRDMIEELKEHQTSEEANKCYGECIKSYDEAIRHMQDAGEEISKHQFEKAIALLRLSLDGGEKCRKAFEDGDQVTPKEAMNQNYNRLINIAVDLLLGSK